MRIMSLIGVSAAVLVQSFVVVSYIPMVLHSSGRLVPIALGALGLGGIGGLVIAPILINRRGAFFAFVASTCGATLALASLMVTRGSPLGAIIPLFMVSVCNAIIVIAQQHRLLSLVPAAAVPFAIGLDGSAAHIAHSAGAGLGGAVLSAFGADALLPTAVGIGLVSIVLAAIVRPQAPSSSIAHTSYDAGHFISLSGSRGDVE